MCEPRLIRSDDIAGVQTLIGNIYSDYGFHLDLDDVDRHLVDPHAYFQERGGAFWVIDADGAIRATVGVLQRADRAELKSLYVHPSYRRHGWGRKLTEMVLDFARRAGRDRIVLWSDTRFIEAHKFYASLGFRRFAERDLNDAQHSREYGFELALVG